MKEKDIIGLTYEDILGKSKGELVEIINTASRKLNVKIFGSAKKRGGLDIIAAKLRKNIKYPIPSAFREGFDYSGIIEKEKLGASKGEERELIRRRNAEIQQNNERIISNWYEKQKARFSKTSATESESLSALRHKASELRDKLSLKTITETGWNKALRTIIKKIETETGISIARKDFKYFFDIVRAIDRPTTTKKDKYEIWRRVAEVVDKRDFSGYTPEQLGRYLKSRMDSIEEEQDEYAYDDMDDEEGDYVFDAGKNKVILPRGD